MLSDAAQDIIRAARDDLFPFAGCHDLPMWVSKLRPQQIDAIERILEAYNNGIKVVVLEAPTGTGKTLIAEVVRMIKQYKSAYVCNTKTLQSQFVGDFNYSKLLMGRDNYPTWISDEITASDCTKVKTTNGYSGCKWCPAVFQCPYEIAKTDAIKSKLAVLNASYFLTECNGPGKFSGRQFVVMDEADTLEGELMRYVSMEISPGRVKQLGLGTPEKVTKEEAWKEWVDAALPKVRRHLRELGEDADVKEVREQRYLERLYGDLHRLSLGLMESQWVYTGKEGQVSFKPVKVDEDAKRYLWPHSQRWLLMSATVISPDEMMQSLGWDEPWEYVSTGSTFPIENRRVKVMALADMSKKKYEKEKLVEAISAILSRHPKERVLVHCVSYELGQYLHAELPRALQRKVSSQSGDELLGVDSLPDGLWVRPDILQQTSAGCASSELDRAKRNTPEGNGTGSSLPQPEMSESRSPRISDSSGEYETSSNGALQTWASTDGRQCGPSGSRSNLSHLSASSPSCVSERDFFTYRNSSERETALSQFRCKPQSILIAPSMDRGVDLKDDDCRVVIVAKIPYPYLGDRQVSARLHTPGGQLWYTVQTIRTLVQMTGRATRHKDDWSVSYVIDSSFGNLWKNRRLFPPWWTEAIDWRDMVRV